MKELRVNAKQQRRAKPLTDFDAPMRRKFPISHPSILQRFARYSRQYAYDYRVKPFGFVQTITPAVQLGTQKLLPVAPYQRDLAITRRLAWIDFNTGKPIWNGQHGAGTIPFMTLNKYDEQYRRHPEAKAADGPW